MHDWRLIRQYVDEGSTKAFDEIVARYGQLVYAASLREVRDPEMARDVFQTVFVVLAHKAHRLRRGTVLAGWLYQTARLAGREALRQERRRAVREQKAAAMEEAERHEDGEVWRQAEPVLNDALAVLSDFDRNLILLRYFGEMTLKEAGEEVGLSENAARMRVSRSLEKMRRYLTRQSATLTIASLAALLSERATHADLAADLAPAVSQAIGSTSIPLTPIAKGVLSHMWHTQLKRMSVAAGAGIAVVAVAAVAAHVVIAQSSGPHPGDIGSVALVREYLAARAAGNLPESYGLLDRFSRSRIPTSQYGAWPPPRAAALPPGIPPQLNVFLTDTRNASGYKYQVLNAEAADPNTVDLLAIPPSGRSSTVKVVTIWDDDDKARRLDLFGTAALNYPPLAPKVNGLKHATQTMANEKEIGGAIYQYANASGHLPDADRWMDEISPYLKDPSIFSDPSDPNQRPYGYAYNRALSGLPLAQVRDKPGTVLVFESSLGTRNGAGLADTLPDPGPVDGGRTGVAFVDGHVEIISDTRRQSMNWQP